MHDRIWLSFDLAQEGEQAQGGERAGIYPWLAEKQARECGPCLASFVFEYESDLIAELENELKSYLNLGPLDRVYVIYKDPEDGEATGLFIVGSRAHKEPFPVNRPATFSQLN